MTKVTLEELIEANTLPDTVDTDNQPDYWFDRLNGDVVIEPEADQMVAYSAGRLLLLQELIEGPTFPIQKGEFKTGYRRWSDTDLLSLGRLAVNLAKRYHAARTESSELTLTKEHLDRLHLLGIAPSYATFEVRFKSIDGIRERIDVPLMHRKNKFEDWSIQDFVEHASGISERLGRKPTRADYLEADGPSPEIIWRRVGGLRRLNAYLGYPNVHEMTRADIIIWGVRFAESNNGTVPTQDTLKILSKRKRGPSDKLVAQRFDGLDNFQRAVISELHSKYMAARKARDEHSHRVGLLRQLNLLPPEFDELPQTEQEGFVGKIAVVRRCLPGRHPSFYRRAASTSNSTFIGTIREQDPKISAATIELIAIRENAFGAIWPVELYANHLRLAA